ncbi:oligopeptide transporter, OPT family [Tsukamurella sp. 8F]|uniref:OPT family oligopeptide transporter n=1 Tax=unclassified Tsukamurella TaxID=2633480 RepID=UPI0023B9251F|nr:MULTISPECIES: oligopeptide transporter, OPT family [unclassified Tsukamurella]MDF0529444.1 oligopeptide transporter, OPT family [Tsukamurella sp. 8J]MDF0589353.1 oligopeptide transporter, OPT family [Tsukamurella sp. 8F]
MASTGSVMSGVRELTLRAVILGGVITLVFTAANVFLGLKVGLTFATSIPAAVISMAILRYFASHTTVENNIVQTIASSAGTLSAIIFVLPGLVMIGYWSGFPYWTTAFVCAIGGVLGVMYSIPLRRALVTGSDLPFPEGVAAAEVLKLGDSAEGVEENRRGVLAIVLGTIASAAYYLLASLKLAAAEIGGAQKPGLVGGVLKVGSGGTFVTLGLSAALVGVGHLVGITVGIAMVIGLVISFGVMLPIRTWGDFTGKGVVGDTVSSIFSSDVRLIGAGAIAIAAVWTLLKIIGPIITGIVAAARSARQRSAGEDVDITERDIPIGIVGAVVVLSMIPIWFLLHSFVSTANSPLEGNSTGIIIVSVLLTLLIGLFVASVCGYMAGLIGASNSPISGVGILVVLFAALLIKAVYGHADASHTAALVAYTLFTASVVFGVATISNDNLQDLKTGQLVGATPWKQQVALIIGVVFGSIVIPPVLGVMLRSYGFAGMPGAGDDALSAPQASLMTTLSKGVFGGDLNWGLIWLGVAIGAAVIVVDEILSRTGRLRVPPLAVGMGMYLPMSVTLMIPIGALVGHYYNRWADRTGGERAESRKRMGVLLATGLIVGESICGVIVAAIVAGTHNANWLGIPDGFGNWAQIIGVVLFVAMISLLYKRTQRIAAAV